jgi:uncharacterized integral membrane protein
MRLFGRRPGGGEIADWQPRLYAIILGLVLITAYVIAFVIKNSDRVPIDFVLFTAHTSLIWLIIFLLATGFLGGVLISQLYRRRKRSGAAAEHQRPHG